MLQVLATILLQLLATISLVIIKDGCSPVNLLHIFRTPFLKNTSGELLFLSASYVDALGWTLVVKLFFVSMLVYVSIDPIVKFSMISFFTFFKVDF